MRKYGTLQNWLSSKIISSIGRKALHFIVLITERPANGFDMYQKDRISKRN